LAQRPSRAGCSVIRDVKAEKGLEWLHNSPDGRPRPRSTPPWIRVPAQAQHNMTARREYRSLGASTLLCITRSRLSGPPSGTTAWQFKLIVTSQTQMTQLLGLGLVLVWVEGFPSDDLNEPLLPPRLVMLYSTKYLGDG
jgi:hypothetical protein